MTAPADGTAPVVQHLETTLGLSFTGPRRQRLLAAIDRARAAAGLPQEAFLDAVARPGSAFDRLVAEVTVGETFFFRDREQCRLLRDLVLPPLRERAPTQVAFWSAGCASGEEAYTLAALADDAGLADRCVVVGSDASARSVERARAGIYGRWSLRSTTPAEQAAHFAQQGERFQIAERHRRRSRFVQRNLLDGPPPPGRFDVVLCRNLLIYLTPEAVRRAAAVLTRSLADDGWLLTAAGDPPLAAEGLEAVRTGLGLAYRRVRVPLPGTARAAVPTRSARRPAPRRAAAPPAAPPPARSGAPEAPPAEDLAATVRALGDAGRLEDACRVAADAVQAHPLDVQLRYLSGVVLLEAGRIEQAAAAAASAVYLGPELPAAHLLLGQAEHARGETARARRSFRNAARLLAAAPMDTPVALAGDVPPEHLAAIASRYLAVETHG